MIRNILIQQREERDILLNKTYIRRIDDQKIAEYLNSTLIKLITGPRRAGKSVFALQLLNNQHFAYLNFDDNLLLNHFDEDAITQGLNDVYAGFNYLMLDEIQNLPDWELWVNKLYRRGVNLVITGSNSRLLSHEMASTLTGRYLQIKVLPFSFAETYRAYVPTLPAGDNLTPAESGKILDMLNSYLFNGGFPETVVNPEILKNYLSALFDSILLKDIIKRFNVRHTQQLYDLSNFMLTNYTNLLSFNQIKEALNLNSVATVQKYAAYLEETYVFQYITRYNNKIKNLQKAARKVYSIDNGFIKARSFELSPNYGRLLENLVFVELFRRGNRPGLDLFYYRTRNNREIDFLIREGYRTVLLIQVCYDMTAPRTVKREIDALSEAAEELGCTNLLLITWDKEDILEAGHFKVNVHPAYKWLLNPES